MDTSACYTRKNVAKCANSGEPHSRETLKFWTQSVVLETQDCVWLSAVNKWSQKNTLFPCGIGYWNKFFGPLTSVFEHRNSEKLNTFSLWLNLN